MLSRMGPSESSFPVRSLALLILAATAVLASGCVSYSHPYGHYGSSYGHSACRGSYGCGSYGYSSGYRRHQTVYVPVYRSAPHYDSYRYDHDRNGSWKRGWNGDDRRDHDRDRHQDRKRGHDDDRRVGPPPQAQPQPQQRQRIAVPRAESPRARSERNPTKGEDWRAERARRGDVPTGSRARPAWLEAREGP